MENLTKNKCSECANSYTRIGKGYQYQTCTLDSKVVNAYGCDRDLLGNNAEEIPNIFDLDDDDYDYMQAQHESRESDMGVR